MANKMQTNAHLMSKDKAKIAAEGARVNAPSMQKVDGRRNAPIAPVSSGARSVIPGATPPPSAPRPPTIVPPTARRPQRAPQQGHSVLPPPSPPQGQYTTGPQAAGTTGGAPTSIAAGMGQAGSARAEGIIAASGGRFATSAPVAPATTRAEPPPATAMSPGAASALGPADIWNGDAFGNGEYETPETGGVGFVDTGRGGGSMSPGAASALGPADIWNGDAFGNGEYETPETGGSFGGPGWVPGVDTGRPMPAGGFDSAGNPINTAPGGGGGGDYDSQLWAAIMEQINAGQRDTQAEKDAAAALANQQALEAVLANDARMGAGGFGASSARASLEGGIRNQAALGLNQQLADIDTVARQEQDARLASMIGLGQGQQGLGLEQQSLGLDAAELAMKQQAFDEMMKFLSEEGGGEGSGVGGDGDGVGGDGGGGPGAISNPFEDNIWTTGTQIGTQIGQGAAGMFGVARDDHAFVNQPSALPDDAEFWYEDKGQKYYRSASTGKTYSHPANASG